MVSRVKSLFEVNKHKAIVSHCAIILLKKKMASDLVEICKEWNILAGVSRYLLLNQDEADSYI